MKAAAAVLLVVVSHATSVRRIMVEDLALLSATGPSSFDATMDGSKGGVTGSAATGSDTSSATGETGATGEEASATGLEQPHAMCFGGTVHPQDQCGACLCEMAVREERSKDNVDIMEEEAEAYCLQQLRSLDGIYPEKTPMWGPGSPSKGAILRVTQEMLAEESFLEVDDEKLEKINVMGVTGGATGAADETGGETGSTSTGVTGATGASTGATGLSEKASQLLRTSKYEKIVQKLMKALKNIGLKHQNLRQKIGRVSDRTVSFDTVAGDVSVMDSGLSSEDHVPAPVSSKDEEYVLKVRTLRINLNSLIVGTHGLMENLKIVGIDNTTHLNHIIGEAATGPSASPKTLELDATGMPEMMGATGSSATGSTPNTGECSLNYCFDSCYHKIFIYCQLSILHILTYSWTLFLFFTNIIKVQVVPLEVVLLVVPLEVVPLVVPLEVVPLVHQVQVVPLETARALEVKFLSSWTKVGERL